MKEEQNRQEELQKIEGAMDGDVDDVSWCQEHFIDVLPWDKKDDWSNVNILEIHGYPKCYWLFLKLGIKNVQECKTGLFEKISAIDPDNGHTKLARLGLQTLREYMENWN